jgi:hypothetical protein
LEKNTKQTLAISFCGSSHFSASASISEVTNFISSPTLAILACSSESSLVGLRPAKGKF